MTIYERLKAAGVPLDNHESDLYARVSHISQAIIAQYKWRKHVRRFITQDSNEAWYDIPFAFDPFWKKAQLCRQNIG